MNWDMLGHDWAVELLKGHIANNTLRHAYLITGPRGVGKRTLALRFIQTLNCTSLTPTGEPCRQCRACKQIELGQYPDLAIVKSDEIGRDLRVDQVRELLHTLALAPYQSKYRAALLLNFDDANQSASNALLKTLEEPPPQVILILTALNSDLLLPTVVSRCETLNLRSLPITLVEQYLTNQYPNKSDQAALYAHLSDGCPGKAIALLRNTEAFTQRTVWLEDHMALLNGSLPSRFSYAEKNKNKERSFYIEMLHTWLSLWRDILLQTTGASTHIVNLDKENEIKSLAQRYPVNIPHQVISSIIRTLELIDKNVNARLALENLMLDLP